MRSLIGLVSDRMGILEADIDGAVAGTRTFAEFRDGLSGVRRLE